MQTADLRTGKGLGLVLGFTLSVRVRVRVSVRVKIKVRVSSSVLPYWQSAICTSPVAQLFTLTR